MIPLPVNIHRMDMWTKAEPPPSWKHLVWAQVCSTRLSSQGKGERAGCSIGPARQQSRKQRSSLPVLGSATLRTKAAWTRWVPQAAILGKSISPLCLHCVFQAEGLLQDHTPHRLTNPRLALPAVPTRVELGNRWPAASRKSLMVPQLPMASQGWHQSTLAVYLDGCAQFLSCGLHFLAPETQRVATPVLKWQ